MGGISQASAQSAALLSFTVRSTVGTVECGCVSGVLFCWCLGFFLKKLFCRKGSRGGCVKFLEAQFAVSQIGTYRKSR